MKKLFVFLALAGLFHTKVLATSILPQTLENQVDDAKAIFRGTVLQTVCYREADGSIYTKTILSVDEALKGRFPRSIQVIHRGGIVDGEGEYHSFSPRFHPGEERLLFLDTRNDGTLFAANGGPSAILLHRQDGGKIPTTSFSADEDALLTQVRQLVLSSSTEGVDTSNQSATASVSSSVVGGLLVDGNGISSRFTAPDRGEKISYIVDAQALPPGITLDQALGAISNAVQAWSQASSVQMVFEGLQNFGRASATVNSNDAKIRIQLHDLYGYITGSTTLGVGGRNYSIPGDFPTGGMGGQVAGQEFFANTRGYVVLKHTQASMQNLATFEEVLCHEIGHVLSLDHSSENPTETDPVLAEATMYYRVHGDGRGATVGTYDLPKIRLVHPLNTPPYAYDRFIEAVTGPTTPNLTGINEVELRGYDLQGTALSILLGSQFTNNGSFTLVGSKLKFTPDGWYSDSPVLDPATTAYYDLAYVRFSDGTNASPFAKIRTTRLYSETKPSGNPDGMPDSWMVTYFGNSDPNVGTKRKANDDFDGDGISNFNEFRSGTNPANSNSVLKMTTISSTNLQFIARPYDVYEIQASTNLTTWNLATNPVVPTTTNANITLSNPGVGAKFFRVSRVP